VLGDAPPLLRGVDERIPHGARRRRSALGAHRNGRAAAPAQGGLVNNARSLALSGRPRGTGGGPVIVYASTKMAGRVWALVDWDGDGTADKLVEIARGLDTPQGLDWYRRGGPGAGGRPARRAASDGAGACTGCERRGHADRAARRRALGRAVLAPAPPPTSRVRLRL
jgi:hypothetical protein